MQPLALLLDAPPPPHDGRVVRHHHGLVAFDDAHAHEGALDGINDSLVHCNRPPSAPTLRDPEQYVHALIAHLIAADGGHDSAHLLPPLSPLILQALSFITDSLISSLSSTTRWIISLYSFLPRYIALTNSSCDLYSTVGVIVRRMEVLSVGFECVYIEVWTVADDESLMMSHQCCGQGSTRTHANLLTRTQQSEPLCFGITVADDYACLNFLYKYHLAS